MGKTPKRPRDTNHLAKSIADRATGQAELLGELVDGKNPAAVALGKLGGLKGGKARAKKLSKAQRKAIAKKAATARWLHRRKQQLFEAVALEKDRQQRLKRDLEHSIASVTALEIRLDEIGCILSDSDVYQEQN